MWKVEDALEGRVSLGKCKDGDLPEEVWLRMPGKRVHQMQTFFEEAAEENKGYFKIRMAVVLAETLRLAVAEFRRQGLRGGGDAGE